MERRTFPYDRLLPYDTSTDDPLSYLKYLVENLELVRAGGDLEGVFGSTSGQIFFHWTRELTQWLKLKAEVPLHTRLHLIKLFFEVLFDATDLNCVERCSTILVELAGPSGYLERHNAALDVDFSKLNVVIHKFMPSNFYRACSPELLVKCIPLVTNVAIKLQILESDEFMSHFEALMPEITGPPHYIGDLSMAAIFILFTQLPRKQHSLYRQLMPQLFYLWPVVPVGALFPLLSFAAVRCLENASVEMGRYGLFDENQMRRIMSGAYRVLKSPSALKLPGHNHRLCAATAIAFSVLPGDSNPVFEMMGTLVKSIEPHSHPLAHSDQTQFLGFLVDLASALTQRIIYERSGEGNWIKERSLDDAACAKFAALVLDGLLYGLYSKSRSTVASVIPALMKLAYLSPDLVLPRLLAEIYPSLRGFYTPHRTLSCLGLLAALIPVLVRHPKFAFHLTSLLELVVPSIDANDPSRAILAYKIVQFAALSVPFAALTESPELAMEHVSAIVDGMEQPGFVYPEYELSEALQILESSTANFDQIVNGLFDHTFLLLENLPEKANEIRGSPESDLAYYAPFAMGCMMYAVSASTLERLADKIIERVLSPLHTSVDAVAHLCAKLVLAFPAGFSKLFRVLNGAIRNEVLENGAAVSRSFGYRDRNFVWYQSILNMIVSVGGSLVMQHKAEFSDLAQFLRLHTKGESVFHVSYFVHHTIQTLASTFCTDYRTFVGEPSLADWGRETDLDKLELVWHVPNEAELKFAVDLYQTHADLSMANVDTALAGVDAAFGTPTEFSDYIALNLTFLRTLTAAISPLVDPLHGVDCSPGGSYLDEDGDVSSAVLYKFKVASGPRAGAEYGRVHEMRIKVGKFLLDTLGVLQAKHDTDVTSFKALLFAIKLWFYDVGVEKSARQDHMIKSVYTSEKRVFKLQGLRKKLYPRPMLARRAQLYHYQRCSLSSRPLTPLDKQMLLALTDSIMSELPDIRFHAECAAYSAIKVMPKSRAVVLASVLDAVSEALAVGDNDRAESGLQFLAFRSIPNVVKRQYKRLVKFAEVVFEAMASDHHKLVHVAYQLGQQVLEDVRMPCVSTSLSVSSGLPGNATVVAALQTSQNQKRATALAQIKQLVDLVTSRQDSHWRNQMVSTVSLHGIVQSPQVPSSAPALLTLIDNSTSANPKVKRAAQTTFVKAMDYIFYGAFAGDCPQKHRLGFDNSTLDKGTLVRSPDEMMAEMANVESPKWFYDFQLMSYSLFSHSPYNHKGWLVWSDIRVQQHGFNGTLGVHDEQQLREFGQHLNGEWLALFIQRLAVEPRPEDNHFEALHGAIFKLLFQLCDLGLCAFSWSDVTVATRGDFNDLNWQRVLAEVSYGLACVQKVASASGSRAINAIALELQTQVINGQFSPEAVKHWMNYLFLANSSIDHRRLWPLLQEFDQLRVDSDSSTKDSVKLALRSTIILSHSWKYQLSRQLVLNLCDNFGHPLESIRTEVAKQLAYILQTRPYHLAVSLSAIGAPHEDLGLIETCFDLVTTDMQNVDKARAFCLFVETLASRKLSAALLAAVIKRVPVLVLLSNVRDDLLVSQLNSTFQALGAMRYTSESLAQITAMFSATLAGATWHQRIRLLLFLQSVYVKNFIEFDPAALDAVLELLFDPQVEVRELAADLLRDWAVCTAPHERQQLVSGLERRFVQQLRTASGTASGSDPARKHGAALGLGALVAAHPYEIPLPPWVPRVLSALAPFSPSVGVVGKSVKKIFGDFKRTRQDSWHIDQKQFSSDELESLEGVLFKNYFV